jgi:hypothetical protein
MRSTSSKNPFAADRTSLARRSDLYPDRLRVSQPPFGELKLWITFFRLSATSFRRQTPPDEAILSA